jgi:hypothetical protein
MPLAESWLAMRLRVAPCLRQMRDGTHRAIAMKLRGLRYTDLLTSTKHRAGRSARRRFAENESFRWQRDSGWAKVCSTDHREFPLVSKLGVLECTQAAQ